MLDCTISYMVPTWARVAILFDDESRLNSYQEYHLAEFMSEVLQMAITSTKDFSHVTWEIEEGYFFNHTNAVTHSGSNVCKAKLHIWNNLKQVDDGTANDGNGQEKIKLFSSLSEIRDSKAYAESQVS